MALSPFLLEDKFDETEKHTKLCLSSASPKPSSIEDLLSLYSFDEQIDILYGLKNLKLDYGEYLGAQSLRTKLLSLYETKLSTESIIVSNGAAEAIFLVFSTLIGPGDKVIVQKPIYQSLYQVATDNGAEIIDWDYDPEKGFDENFANLEKLFKSHDLKGATLVLNNPNNPMGIVFREIELKKIVSLCEVNNVTLIVDEVLKELSWGERIPSALELYEKAIVISDLTKSHGFAGLRLGWLVAKDTEIIKKLAGQKAYLSIRSCSLSEYLAPFILDKQKIIVGDKLNTICANYNHLYSLEGKLPFDFGYIKNSDRLSGLSLFPKLKNPDDFNDEKLEKYLNEHGLFIARGDLFGADYTQHIRLGLGIEEEKFKEALSVL